MDEFVENQLNSAGCGHLIPLFRDNGYNEDSFRNLRMRTLIQLIPDDDDAVENLWNIIRSLSNPANSSEVFPPPNVFIKPDPDQDQPGQPLTPPPEDDEVQFVKVLINGPSGFTREVKKEREESEERRSQPATASGRDSQPGPSSASVPFQFTGPSTSLPIANENVNTYEQNTENPVEPEAEHPETVQSDGHGSSQPAAGPSTAASFPQASGTPPPLPTADENMNTNEENTGTQPANGTTPITGDNASVTRERNSNSNWNLRSQLVRKYEERDPDSEDEDWDEGDYEHSPKFSRISLADQSKWKRVQTVLSKIKGNTLKTHFHKSIRFTFSKSEQFDQILALLKSRSCKLSEVVKEFDLTSSKAKRDVRVTNSQLIQLASISVLFFDKLTTLEIDLDFSEDIDFAILSTILTKCSNLQHFTMWRGVTLNEQKSLWIPKMDKLVSFYFAVDFLVRTINYCQPPTIVEVEVDNCDNNPGSIPAKFEIDFGDRVYPELEQLFVGPSCNMKYNSITQFPKLQALAPLVHLRNSIEEPIPACQKMNRVNLYPSIRLDLIHEIPLGFPNLANIYLLFPSVGILRCIIQTLAHMRIKRLKMTVNYEFESALSTALRGLPFKLITESDKAKLEKMKQYEHWKGFLDYLKIEIPLEGDACDQLSPTEGEREKMVGIGSFGHLEHLYIDLVGRNVFIPEENVHWSSPEAKLSAEKWSSCSTFPTCVLLDDLTKLNGVLKEVELWDFKVEPNVAAQFRRAMGCKLRIEFYRGVVGHKDCYSDRDFLSANIGIKEEEEQMAVG